MFRVSKELVEVRVFSIEGGQKLAGTIHDLGGFKVKFVFGDFSDLILLLISHLEEAKKYGSELQSEILNHYIDYYRTGEFSHFEQSQIKWVKDEDPKVESNFGF